MTMFYGLKTYNQAVKVFGEKYLNNPKWKTKIKQHKVCDDATVWPQTFSKTIKTKQIITNKHTIEFNI